MAAELGIELRWLLTVCSELNPVEELWRRLKEIIRYIHQANDFGQTAVLATKVLREFGNHDALNKAGILPRNFSSAT